MIIQEALGDLQLKWRRLQEEMSQMGADGCLLSVDVNLYYVTGRVYNGYFYLPVEGEPLFFVKRPNGLSGERLTYIYKPEQMKELLEAAGIPLPSHLLLEADELSYNDYQRLLSVFHPDKTSNATALLRRLRAIKTPGEIDLFRLSARQHAKAYSEIPSCYQPGMTDVELQAEIERRMRRHGSMGIFRTFGANMDIFMGSLLTGDNAGEPSPFDFALGGAGISTSLPIGANGTPLQEGMAIMVDMAGNFTPYITDMTRVFSIGKLPEEAYRAHQTALEMQQRMEKIAAPGSSCAELYNLSLEMAEKAGLSDKFMGTKQQAKFVGHGIGIQINELPVLTPRSKELLQPNMVFAFEPKFVIPGVGAVGIENSYLVTETGLEKLTIFEEQIIPLDR